MRPDVQQLLARLYPPGGARPLEADEPFDPRWERHKALVEALRTAHPLFQPGTRGAPELSSEWLLAEQVRLQLSHRGPFAALSWTALDPELEEVVRRVRFLLSAHGYSELGAAELAEEVPWLRSRKAAEGPRTVRACLFDGLDLSSGNGLWGGK